MYVYVYVYVYVCVCVCVYSIHNVRANMRTNKRAYTRTTPILLHIQGLQNVFSYYRMCSLTTELHQSSCIYKDYTNRLVWQSACSLAR